MLTKERNDRLTRVGPGTPMGELFRRYWQPIAGTAELEEEPVKAVRILGEDLVLYRDRSGTLGLIGDRCPHRKVNLLYGIPEEEGLRCPYHGWRFNEEGRCVEQPYEEAEDPNSNFKEKIRTKAYRVQELNGLIFAYMGPEPAPELPKWDLFVWDNVYRDVGISVLPCNYLQCMENSLDPVHVEWLHNRFANYVLDRLGRPVKGSPYPHKKIGFDVSQYGITKRRVLEGKSEEDPDWRVGHPVIFPNILRVGGFQYRVPVDDEHTLHIWYYCYATPEGAPPQEHIPVYQVPVPTEDARGLPRWELLDNNSGQDVWAWYSQGPIADRTTEHLGLSDKGIILYRRLLEQQLQVMEQGGDPINVFRDPAECAYIKIETEESAPNRTGRSTGVAPSTPAAVKYSPVLQALAGARNVGVEEALTQR